MWMKRWIPRKRWARVVVIGGSVALMTLAADMVLVQAMRGITVSVETTRVVAPLTKRGTPDYLEAVNERLGAGVKPRENAAPLLLKIVGRRLRSLAVSMRIET